MGRRSLADRCLYSDWSETVETDRSTAADDDDAAVASDASLSAERARPSRETDGDLVNDRLVCSINVLPNRLVKLGVKLCSNDSCVSFFIRVASASTSSRATLSEKQTSE